MASRTKAVGLVGEQVLIAEFVKRGVTVLLPVGDNLPYDLVIETRSGYLKGQVKTTERVNDGKMVFATNITNPFKKTSRKYTESEIDFFGLYCIENGYVGIMPVSECTAKDTIIRIDVPRNNQAAKVKMASDYAFERKILGLL